MSCRRNITAPLRAIATLFAVLVALALAPAGLGARVALAQVAYEEGVVLVSFEEGTTAEEANALLAESDLVEVRELDQDEVDASIVELELAEGCDELDVAAALSEEGIVSAAQPNYAYGIAPCATQTNDPSLSSQWALTSIRATSAWDYITTDGAVTVAALDSGVDITHPDLAANIVAPYNAVTGTSDVLGTSEHGTHVAGIIAGVANNGIGVAGVSYNARVMPIKVSSDDGLSYTTALVAAYDYILEHADEYNIRVVNISLGANRDPNDFPDSAFLAKIDEARARGIVTVASAGNGSSPFNCYPGDYPAVVSVMNLAQTGGGVDLAGDSNYNAPGERDKDICAPGTGILTTSLAGGYDSAFSGTSMAAPHVSGALALMFAANPSLTADEAVEILFATATDLGPAGWDERYGYGELNVLEAVIAAGGYERKEEPEPEPESADDKPSDEKPEERPADDQKPTETDEPTGVTPSDAGEKPDTSAAPDTGAVAHTEPPLAEQAEGTPPTGEPAGRAEAPAALAGIGLAMVFLTALCKLLQRLRREAG